MVLAANQYRAHAVHVRRAASVTNPQASRTLRGSLPNRNLFGYLAQTSGVASGALVINPPTLSAYQGVGNKTEQKLMGAITH